MENSLEKKNRFSLSGPLTWILLVVLLFGFFYGISLFMIDTPAKAIRNYFEASFTGDYEKAWTYILENSPFMQLKGDVTTFSETWERGKNHGTEYVGIRIDGVMRNKVNTESKVLYTIMQYDQTTKEKVPGSPEKGLYKVKVLKDSFVGSMFLAKDASGNWKLRETEY